MAALDFPVSPVDGQQFSSNGITYYYNANIGTWLTQLVNTNVGASGNTQVLFNDAGVSNGSYGLVFNKGANTLYTAAVTASGTVKSTSSTGFLAQNSTATGSNAYRIINNSGSLYLGTENSAGTDYGLPAYSSFLYSNYSSPMCFVNNGAERMRITSGGQVGIASAIYTTVAPLTVTNVGKQLTLQAYAGSQNNSVSFECIRSDFTTNAACLAVYTNSGTAEVERMRIDNNGNVGIGTNSPAYKLDVVGTINASTDVQNNGVSLNRFVRSTKTTTSGTTTEWTGLPSWVQRITIYFLGVGGSVVQPVVQLGSSTYTTTGYNIGYCSIAGGTSPTTGTFTTGWSVNNSTSVGFLTLVLITGNTWHGTYLAGNYQNGNVTPEIGYVTLGGVLDRVRLFTTSGALNSGSATIIYEG